MYPLKATFALNEVRVVRIPSPFIAAHARGVDFVILQRKGVVEGLKDCQTFYYAALLLTGHCDPVAAAYWSPLHYKFFESSWASSCRDAFGYDTDDWGLLPLGGDTLGWVYRFGVCGGFMSCAFW